MPKRTTRTKSRARRKRPSTKAKKPSKGEPVARHPSPHGGYDYGFKPWMAAVGSFDFVNNLRDADVGGVAYGSNYDEKLGEGPPFVSLVGRNEEPLRRAFEQFATWSKETDGDAVELTFVFLKDGSYIIGLSPEATRLVQRLTGFNRTHQPLYMLHLWRHHLRTTSSQTLRFREYKRSLVSPFYLCGSVQPALSRGAANAGTNSDLKIISPAILKFEATFIDEADVEPNTIAATLLRMRKAEATQSDRPKTSAPHDELKGPPKPSPAQVRKTRSEALRRHFPVTLGRIAASSRLLELKAQVIKRGVQDWQFVQAICNLTLCAEMGSRPHFMDVTSDNLTESIAEALSQRHESADGKGLPGDYPAEQVLEQVRLDAACLLHAIGGSGGMGHLSSLQKRLADMNLLSEHGEAS